MRWKIVFFLKNMRIFEFFPDSNEKCPNCSMQNFFLGWKANKIKKNADEILKNRFFAKF